MRKCLKLMCLVLALLIVVSMILAGCESSDEKKKLDDSFLKNKNEKTSVVFYIPRLPDASNSSAVFDQLSAKALSAFNINLV